MAQASEKQDVAENSHSTSALGRVIIAPDVLVAIVRQTIAHQPGIVRLANQSSHLRNQKKSRKAQREGIQIDVADDNSVTVDVWVVVMSTANFRDVAETAQTEITRELSHMTDMPVRQVNIHIEDVALDPNAGQEIDALPDSISSARHQI